jgi:phage anti-repressor protein
MIKLNENDKCNARDIYNYVEVKTRFHVWIQRCIDYADLKEGKDFITELVKSNGGRPSKEYYFTINSAKEICIVSATHKAKELRRWLIELSNKRDSLDLITIKEAAFAVKVINCLKYIDNQKEAYALHQKSFIQKNTDILNPKYIYSEFAKYRTSIVGYSKQQIDEAIESYLMNHAGYDRRKVKASNMQTKLSILDIGEAIRVAVLDILYSNETDKNLASKFSELCKKMAAEMKVEANKTNQNNLFRNSENIESVKSLQLTAQ